MFQKISIILIETTISYFDIKLRVVSIELNSPGDLPSLSKTKISMVTICIHVDTFTIISIVDVISRILKMLEDVYL